MTLAILTNPELNRCINIIISADKIEQLVKKKLIELTKKVRINGFRKGKVPIEIINQYYGASVIQETLNELMTYNFVDLIKKENIEILGKPNYLPGNYKVGKDFSYSVEFEIYPDINFKDLENIEIEKPLVKVTEIDIDHMLIILQKQKATWKETNAIANMTNRVTIDFIGLLNGKELKGHKEYNYTIDLSTNMNNNIPYELKESIIQHKAGERFSVKVHFPEDHYIEDLKGHNVNFDVFLRKVEICVLPEWNKNFIKSFGIEEGTIESLRVEIRKNMEREMRLAIRKYLRTQIVQGLINEIKIDLPKRIINEEIELLRRQAVKNTDNEKVKFISEEQFEKEAKSRVLTSVLFSKIVRTNNLNVNETRVQELINDISSSYENPLDVIKFYSKDKKTLDKIRDFILEEQVMELLLSIIKVKNMELNFYELLNKAYNI